MPPLQPCPGTPSADASSIPQIDTPDTSFSSLDQLPFPAVDLCGALSSAVTPDAEPG